jgi:hypothetical protein
MEKTYSPLSKGDEKGRQVGEGYIQWMKTSVQFIICIYKNSIVKFTENGKIKGEWGRRDKE